MEESNPCSKPPTNDSPLNPTWKEVQLQGLRNLFQMVSYLWRLMDIHMACLWPPSYIWGFVKNPISIKWFFRTLSFFFPSYRFLSRWLHTFIKQFILWFLWGMSASNHKLYIFFLNLVPAKLRFSSDIRKTTCKVYAKRDVNHQKWAVSHTDHF